MTWRVEGRVQRVGDRWVPASRPPWLVLRDDFATGDEARAYAAGFQHGAGGGVFLVTRVQETKSKKTKTRRANS